MMFGDKIKKYTVVLLFLGMISLTLSFKSNFFEVAKQIEIYTTLFKELNIYYIDEINPAELTSKVIKNTLKDLDPYTNYFDEQEVEKETIRREGAYAGIGISVFYDPKGILIKEVFKGFEADQKKLKAGDIITKVGDQSLLNMDKAQMSEMLKGAINQPIDIEILRKGTTIKRTVVPEKVVLNPVPFYDLIDQETGYIVLTKFNLKASSEVKKAFKELKSRGMKNLIFDLRSNPGGSLGEAIKIANFFLPKGSTIAMTKAKVKKWSSVYKALNTPLDIDIPLTVLINGNSASASEIVAGALQDFDRAIIVGERSFGKGLVQKYRPLTYGTQLKLTISKYYTPSGRCIQELDYSSRDEQGNVPKFSDGMVNSFKTKNGRTVYDGGGILPDIVVGYPKSNTTTNNLIQSRAIFNYITDYVDQHPTIDSATDYSFSKIEFANFLEYIVQSDTVFKTNQQHLFLQAFNGTKDRNVFLKEHQHIMKKLNQQKISDISEDQEYLSDLIQGEILKRFYYLEGVYQNNLKNDKVILKASEILKNHRQYNKILKKS